MRCSSPESDAVTTVPRLESIEVTGPTPGELLREAGVLLEGEGRGLRQATSLSGWISELWLAAEFESWPDLFSAWPVLPDDAALGGGVGDSGFLEWSSLTEWIASSYTTAMKQPEASPAHTMPSSPIPKTVMAAAGGMTAEGRIVEGLLSAAIDPLFASPSAAVKPPASSDL